jgi:hypothetical protein
MKTTIEVLNEVLGEERVDQNDIDANLNYRTTLGEIQKCMREYGLQIVDEIINGDYVETVQDGTEEYPSVNWDDVKREKLLEQIYYQ